MPPKRDPAVEKAPRRTQAERRRESERRMLRAAAELIAEQGFCATSLDEIGLRAGYSRGLVSHRFGCKEGLAQAFIQQVSRQVYRHTIDPAVTGRPSLDAILTLADGYVAGLEVDLPHTRALYILMFESLGQLPSIRPAVKALTDSFTGVIRQLLEEAAAAGDIRTDVNPDHMATHIVCMLRGITQTRLLMGESLDLATARAELAQTLTARLKP